MNLQDVEQIANAILYEGYILWPYRPTSLKNQKRWSFGGLAPQGTPGETSLHCRALVLAQANSELEVAVRFLQPVCRKPVDTDGNTATSLRSGDRTLHAWDEALERTHWAGPVWIQELEQGFETKFSWPAATVDTAVPDAPGFRWKRTRKAIEGTLCICATALKQGAAQNVYRLDITVTNHTALTTDSDKRAIELSMFNACHAVLGIRDGLFSSATDPLSDCAPFIAEVGNERTWPILVGDRAQPKLLCSPIIMSDFPSVAPESHGDLFDATENDELLTLSIMSLTQEEQLQMADIDPRARAILERTASFGSSEMLQLHGAKRGAPKLPVQKRTDVLGPGDRVRLRPRRRADIMDLVLQDKLATITSVEMSVDDEVYYTVSIDDDPGRDLAVGKFVGHRFFFSVDEVERVDGESATKPS